MSSDLGSGGMVSPVLSIETRPERSMQSMYVKFDGINGESFDKDHKDWIDVLSYSYAVTQSTSSASGGGSGVGRANFGNFMFTHNKDIASPNLMLYCAKGKMIPKVVFAATKAGDGQQQFETTTFTDVLVTGVNIIGATNSPRSLEQVTFSYTKITMEVKKQNEDGSLGAAVSGTWDTKANKE